MDPIGNKPNGFYGLSMVFTMSYEFTQCNYNKPNFVLTICDEI